jgi:hypothetical protein
MKVIDFDIEIPRYKNFTEIAIIGDVHKGNEFFDPKEEFGRYYDGTEGHKGFKDDSNMYAITTGDLMETALKESLGVQDQSEWIEDQFIWIRDKLTPIAEDGRLIGVIEGNHEHRATRNWIRTTRLLAHDLDVPYCAGYLLVNVNLHKGDKTRTYKIAAHHGYGYARSLGGMVNAVLRMTDVVGDADAYVMGHLHNKFAIVSPIKLNGKWKERLLGMTGAYMKYGGYVENRLYKPPARGSLKLKLHFDINRVTGR